MSRFRRFLANPYKTRAIASRFLGGMRRWVAAKRLERIRPEALQQHLGLNADPAVHFRSRTQPNFFFDAERIHAIVAAIPEEAKEWTIRDAQQVLARTFTFRGLAPVTFTDEINWQFAGGNDVDWNADLNRLDWVVTTLLAAHYTNEAKFAEYASAVLAHWWRSNPPGSVPWRDPFEVAQRGNTLSWILFLGTPLPAFSDEAIRTVLCALLASGRWTEATLEYHIPNNHLLIEAVRLTQLGLLFPEFPQSQRWLCRGLRLVGREVARQVFPDGVHAERSVFYQRIVLEALLEVIALAERNGLTLPDIIHERSRKMLLFLHDVLRPDGEFPLLGDGFRCDILLRYNLLAAGAQLVGIESKDRQPDERTLWLLNGRWPSPPAATKLPSANLWAEGGYAVLGRAEPEGHSYLIFDFGEFGMAAAPGHGHADCLSLELCVYGRPFLVDPGTYSCCRGEHWRNAFRSTRAHNTVLVDGRDQTPLREVYGAGRFAHPSLRAAILGDWLRLIDASHDGYTRLRGKVIHRRSIIEMPHDGWLVIDFLTGKGCHDVKVLWHFHPAVSTFLTDLSFHAQDESGTGLEVVWSASAPLQPWIYRGQEKPPLGWVSIEAGRREPADVLVLGANLLLPAWIVTLLAPFKELSRQPRLHSLLCSDGVAITCKVEGVTTTAFLTLDAARGANFDRWSTDAAIAVIREAPGEKAFLLAGGRLIEKDGEEHLHLPAATKGVAVTATAEQLYIQGDTQFPVHILCGPIRQAFVNGREAKVLRQGTRIAVSEA